MRKKLSISIILLFVTCTNLLSQGNYKSTIKGTVIDKQSQIPLIGASVILNNSDPLIGTVTDNDGNFRIENIPIGRHTLKISYIGYFSYFLTNILLSSGKEKVVNVELEEQIITTDAVIITASSRKEQPINRMATVSARSFTVDEAKRYPGSLGDPARMASNYAGVMSISDNRNDIIIRGNTPMGLLWRLDGIEIPNPSHFGALGTTGGPVTILNSNLLANSDFFSGAFPAEYGNAISGVFDLKMRIGNNEKREYWGQIGWNGMELGAEGPFSKKHKASYIFIYRKNVMSLINALGIDIGIVPSEYQDLTFKIDIPTKKFGKFSLIGIGGIGNVNINDSEEDQKDWTFTDAGENLFNGSKMGVLGLNHLLFLNKKTRVKTILSVQYAYVKTRLDTFSLENIEPFIKLGEENREVKYSFSTHLKKKISARSNMSVGIYYDIYNVMFDDSTYKHVEYVKETDIYSVLSLFRAFGEWQYKFSDNITSYAGVHYQNLLFNNTTSIEPRVGFSWKVTGNKSLNIGYGRHCQIQPRMMYFIQTLLPDNSVALTNRDLDLIKSDQVILGYDHLVNENLRVKVEAYYQSMFDVPVKENFPEYSLINSGANFFIRREDSLVNTGTAENYGVELTVERFFSTNYFVLFTASFFESKYRGSDNSERNTAFNGNYVVNALGGYEKKIGKHHLISFSLRAKFAGGKPYVPFDVEQTKSRGEVIFDWDHAYKVKYSDYYRIDLRIGFKRNRPKVNIEYALDLQNVTGHKNVFMERINVKTGEIQSIFQIGFYPMVTWRIQF